LSGRHDEVNPTRQADEGGELFPAHYSRIELETSVVYEGFTFRVVFRDVSLKEAVAALTRRGCAPAESAPWRRRRPRAARQPQSRWWGTAAHGDEARPAYAQRLVVQGARLMGNERRGGGIPALVVISEMI
jgi:hypothetical protein